MSLVAARPPPPPSTAARQEAPFGNVPACSEAELVGPWGDHSRRLLSELLAKDPPQTPSIWTGETHGASDMLIAHRPQAQVMALFENSPGNPGPQGQEFSLQNSTFSEPASQGLVKQ